MRRFPSMARRDFDVVLYGATGYTGQLIAEALDDEGASFAVAGRDPARLTALSSRLPSKPETIAVGIDDAPGLREMAGRARAVCSAAGPFARLGPPVVRGALAAGTSFVDITGEQAFLRWCQEHDQAVREAGVALINATGFDVVPSDLASVLACEGLPEVASLELCIATNARMSQGTRRSGVENAHRGAWYDDGTFRVGPAGRFVRSFELPEPLGERTAVFIPWGDCVTAPRSTGAKRVRTFFMASPEKARSLHLSWPLMYGAAQVPFVRERLARKVASGGNQSAEERANARFTILAEATAPDGEIQRAVVEGCDPYGLTGVSAAKASLALARGEVEGIGVMTPSQALDIEAFAKGLGAFEVGWRRL